MLGTVVAIDREIMHGTAGFTGTRVPVQIRTQASIAAGGENRVDARLWSEGSSHPNVEKSLRPLEVEEFG